MPVRAQARPTRTRAALAGRATGHCSAAERRCSEAERRSGAGLPSSLWSRQEGRRTGQPDHAGVSLRLMSDRPARRQNCCPLGDGDGLSLRSALLRRSSGIRAPKQYRARRRPRSRTVATHPAGGQGPASSRAPMVTRTQRPIRDQPEPADARATGRTPRARSSSSAVSGRSAAATALSTSAYSSISSSATRSWTRRSRCSRNAPTSIAERIRGNLGSGYGAISLPRMTHQGHSRTIF